MLYFVRHGQTDFNREQRFQSRTDVPLNATGIGQAESIRDELTRRAVRFRAARCSPLSRARETARIVLAPQALEFDVEPAFIELDLGKFEGSLESALREELGEAYDLWRETHYLESAPGGESLFDAARRVADPLGVLRAMAVTADVLIVAHQGVNMAMKAVLAGTFDLRTVASFRQANDDIDVWDVTAGRRVERVTVPGARA